MEHDVLLQMTDICKGAGSCFFDSEEGNRPRADGRKRRRKIHPDEMLVWYVCQE